MPKLNERERLADLEARQRKIGDEIEDARRVVRSKYASIVTDLPVEQLTEREFRELLTLALATGGAPAVAALKGLSGSTALPKSGAKSSPAPSPKEPA